MSLPARTLATIAATVLLLGSIGLSLWRADWRYSLPTPRPPALVQPASIAPDVLARLRAAAEARSPTEPLLVHFYNPDCPCSRFNRDHVLALVDEFGGRVAELALLELSADETPPAPGRDAELGMNALAETDGQLARALGVYSTPQAVLIDAGGRVYFRGNYNQNRFCTRAESAYAKLATRALLAGLPCPPFPEDATRAYGCELPNAAAEADEP